MEQPKRCSAEERVGKGLDISTVETARGGGGLPTGKACTGDVLFKSKSPLTNPNRGGPSTVMDVWRGRKEASQGGGHTAGSDGDGGLNSISLRSRPFLSPSSSAMSRAGKANTCPVTRAGPGLPQEHHSGSDEALRLSGESWAPNLAEQLGWGREFTQSCC